MSQKEKGNELEEFVKFQINRKVIPNHPLMCHRNP